MYQPPPPPPPKNNTVLWVILAVVGVCGCGVVVVVGAILFPVFQSAKVAATRTTALSNVKQSATALVMYATDNNDCLPPGSVWMDKAEKYSRSGDAVFKSPDAVSKDPGAYSFAFRKGLAGENLNTFMEIERTAMVFDSTVTTRNAYADLDTLPDPPRYSNVNAIGFLDGHAKLTLPATAKALPTIKEAKAR